MWLDRIDSTKQGIGRVIALLGFLYTAEIGIHLIGGVLETIILGFIGPEYLSGVTLSISVLTVVDSLFVELGTGLTCIVAQLIGKKDFQNAARTLGQTILLCVVISIPISFLGVILTPLIFDLFGVESLVKQIGIPYLALGFAFIPVLILPFINNAYLRAVGHATTVVAFELLQLFLLAFLLPTLIFGYGFIPKLSATGGMLALIVARATALVFQLIFIWKKSRPSFQLMDLKPDRQLIEQIIRLSLPSTFHQVVRFGAELILVRMVAGIGTLAVAGYAIGVQFIRIIETIGQGFGNAVFTTIGQNIGAGNQQRAFKGTWLGVLYCSSISVLVIIPSILFPKELAHVFIRDVQVINIAAQVIQIVSVTYIFIGATWIFIRGFHGGSDTTTPMIVDLIILWGVQLPFAYLFGWVLEFSLIGILIAISISNVSRVLLLYAIFKRNSLRLFAMRYHPI